MSSLSSKPNIGNYNCPNVHPERSVSGQPSILWIVLLCHHTEHWALITLSTLGSIFSHPPTAQKPLALSSLNPTKADAAGAEWFSRHRVFSFQCYLNIHSEHLKFPTHCGGKAGARCQTKRSRVVQNCSRHRPTHCAISQLWCLSQTLHPCPKLWPKLCHCIGWWYYWMHSLAWCPMVLGLALRSYQPMHCQHRRWQWTHPHCSSLHCSPSIFEWGQFKASSSVFPRSVIFVFLSFHICVLLEVTFKISNTKFIP